MVEPSEEPIYQVRLIHFGHSIFDLVALDENGLAKAEAHLLESVTLCDKKFLRLSKPTTDWHALRWAARIKQGQGIH